ncbi:MAG TPA: HEAT repeat domain-containing protein [Phototrophicaceae bacterium]|nr:HEAT repeat domain-containing protein [Phototrophicaceae bacterium]
MEDVQHLIEQLKNASIPEKWNAFNQLSGLGSPAIQPLVDAISETADTDIEEVLSVVEWESNGENQQLDEPFQAFQDLTTESCWYILAATKIFSMIGDPAFESILALTRHESKAKCTWAAYTLGEMRANLAVPALMKLLDTLEDQARIWAIGALAKLKAFAAVDRLVELLQDDDEYIQHVAAEALGEIGDERALNPLIDDLKRHKHNVYAVSAALRRFGALAVDKLIMVLEDENSQKVHHLVMMDLSFIGDRRAVLPILKRLEQTTDNRIQSSAISALSMLKAEETLEAINRVMHTTQDITLRYTAAKAIGEIGGEKAFKILSDAYETGSFEVQHCAVLAMGSLSEVPNIQLLLNALTSPNHYLRSGAAVTFGNLRDVRAVDALRVAQNDLDDDVRRYAADALKKIENGVGA